VELLPSEQGQRWPEAHQHWIVLISRRPSKVWTVLLAALAVSAYVWPDPMVWPFLVVGGLLGLQRYRLWRSERIVLTNRRIIHIQGVLETTRTEAWLRLDRISGMRINETFFGNLLGYASIAVEAPGDHPGLKRLYRIDKAHDFYRRVRNTSLGEPAADPDDLPGDYITEQLPDLGPRDRFRRR
jgi:uncharacterized membrane protein YdbT with pleckstrin-like domain